MITYDFRCANGHIQIDSRVNYGDRPPCPECGAAVEILWASSFPAVIGDEIPGGLVVEHMTPEPETFYSRSEHRRRVKELGLRIRDEHNPPPGSDKAKFTSKWY